MAYKGYHFFVGDLELPYAPSELTLTVGSNNQTVNLINGNEISILKDPKLTEIKFDVELPRGRQYAFANKLIPSKTYTDYFEELMLEKKPTRLIITRPNPAKGYRGIGGTAEDFESTALKVSLEGYSLKESAKNAYDITVSLKFKEYEAYKESTKTVAVQYVDTKPKEIIQPVTKSLTKNKQYTVKKGDKLYTISRRFYGTSSKWKKIYEANKKVIEQTARKYGKRDSSNGHWIYPGTKLIIPSTTT